MSVNKVILLGNLGKDAEVKYSASGTAVCRFSLATNETFKNKAGDVEKRTEWHSVVAFGRLAEVCGEYLSKGKLCYIEGSIRSGNWKTATATNAHRMTSLPATSRCFPRLGTGPNPS